MKRVEELVPLIVTGLRKVLSVKDAKILVDSDLKKHLRNARISLEDVSKNVRTLRTSFLNNLGYFPDGTAENLKEVQDLVSNTISKLKETEVKYFSAPKESFGALRDELIKSVEDLIKKMESL